MMTYVDKIIFPNKEVIMISRPEGSNMYEFAYTNTNIRDIEKLNLL